MKPGTLIHTIAVCLSSFAVVVFRALRSREEASDENEGQQEIRTSDRRFAPAGRSLGFTPPPSLGSSGPARQASVSRGNKISSRPFSGSARSRAEIIRCRISEQLGRELDQQLRRIRQSESIASATITSRQLYPATESLLLRAAVQRQGERWSSAGSAKVIPWFKEAYKGPAVSVCKDRWIAIRKGNRMVYAQWEDAGPFRTDHWQYVFGNERPKPNLNHGAGSRCFARGPRLPRPAGSPM